MRDGLATAVAFLVVFLGAAALALPATLARVSLGPDAIGYIATAANWLSGRGFVEPIVYSYYLADLTPPAPATAIRPPLLVFLLAIPVALGAGLKAICMSHTLWACAVGASALPVARRVLPFGAAIAFAIAVAWSPGWTFVAHNVLPDATAIGVLLASIVLLRPALGSSRGAVALALLTVLGWTVRPNLLLIAPAFAATCVVELGPGGALRARPLWIYLAAFLVLWRALALVIELATGLPPYAHYAVMLEILTADQAALYRAAYAGPLAFARAHFAELLSLWSWNLSASASALVTAPFYLHVGIVALPALLWAFVARDSSPERHYAAIAAVLFLGSAIAIYGGFDPGRYLLPSVVALWFVAVSGLSELGDQLARRVRDRIAPGGSPPFWARPDLARSAVPLAVVLVLWAARGAPIGFELAWNSFTHYRERGSRPLTDVYREHPDGPWTASVRAFCNEIDPDAIVAAPEPWTLHLWCGNAAYWLPPDLDSLGWVHRYLDERSPGYLISAGNPPDAMLAQSPRLEELARRRRHVLYRVVDAPARSRPWRAPPPLIELGAGSD